MTFTWQPCREETGPLPYFLHNGTASKLEFNVAGLKVPYTQLLYGMRTHAHTEFLVDETLNFPPKTH